MRVHLPSLRSTATGRPRRPPAAAAAGCAARSRSSSSTSATSSASAPSAATCGPPRSRATPTPPGSSRRGRRRRRRRRRRWRSGARLRLVVASRLPSRVSSRRSTASRGSSAPRGGRRRRDDEGGGGSEVAALAAGCSGDARRCSAATAQGFAEAARLAVTRRASSAPTVLLPLESHELLLKAVAPDSCAGRRRRLGRRLGARARARASTLLDALEVARNFPAHALQPESGGRLVADALRAGRPGRAALVRRRRSPPPPPPPPAHHHPTTPPAARRGRRRRRRAPPPGSRRGPAGRRHRPQPQQPPWPAQPAAAAAAPGYGGAWSVGGYSGGRALGGGGQAAAATAAGGGATEARRAAVAGSRPWAARPVRSVTSRARGEREETLETVPCRIHHRYSIARPSVYSPHSRRPSCRSAQRTPTPSPPSTASSAWTPYATGACRRSASASLIAAKVNPPRPGEGRLRLGLALRLRLGLRFEARAVRVGPPRGRIDRGHLAHVARKSSSRTGRRGAGLRGRPLPPPRRRPRRRARVTATKEEVDLVVLELVGLTKEEVDAWHLRRLVDAARLLRRLRRLLRVEVLLPRSHTVFPSTSGMVRRSTAPERFLSFGAHHASGAGGGGAG